MKFQMFHSKLNSTNMISGFPRISLSKIKFAPSLFKLTDEETRAITQRARGRGNNLHASLQADRVLKYDDGTHAEPLDRNFTRVTIYGGLRFERARVENPTRSGAGTTPPRPSVAVSLCRARVYLLNSR